jgi:uncharacterized membrane protein
MLVHIIYGDRVLQAASKINGAIKGSSLSKTAKSATANCFSGHGKN